MNVQEEISRQIADDHAFRNAEMVRAFAEKQAARDKYNEGREGTREQRGRVEGVA